MAWDGSEIQQMNIDELRSYFYGRPQEDLTENLGALGSRICDIIQDRSADQKDRLEAAEGQIQKLADGLLNRGLLDRDASSHKTIQDHMEIVEVSIGLMFRSVVEQCIGGYYDKAQEISGEATNHIKNLSLMVQRLEGLREAASSIRTTPTSTSRSQAPRDRRATTTTNCRSKETSC